MGSFRKGGGGDNCSLEYVFKHVEKVSQTDGTIYLRKEDFENEDFKGAGVLQVDMINGDYFMTLLYYEDDGELEVRDFTNKERAGEVINFNKEDWSGAFICNDLSIVKEACRQFIETGDVSQDILS